MSQSIKDEKVCILGLGYVGLTLAVAMSDTGYRVHGLEARKDVIDNLKQGKPHFWEPRLREKLQRVIGTGDFTLSQEVDPDFKASVYIITVGTPLKEGAAYLGSVEAATRQVSSSMQDNALIILRSTVKLGTARNVVKPILEESGKNFSLAVCPERTLEGRALIELYELPQIIGADNDLTRSRCAALFGAMTHTTVKLSSLEAAELTKLVDNTYRDVIFGFSNEIALLCSKAGLSAKEIIRAGKLGYPRTNVALPGPVGGPCLEKDPHILLESARSWGLSLPITAASRIINEKQPSESISFIKNYVNKLGKFPERPVITLAGLAFKGVPATDDLRGTMAKPILEEIIKEFPGSEIRLFDPIVDPDSSMAYFGIKSTNCLDSSIAESNIVLIANNHPVFQSLDMTSISEKMSTPGIIYDFWNMHDDAKKYISNNIVYMALGSENIDLANLFSH